MTITRVSVTTVIKTICPNTVEDDESAVTITWAPKVRVDAEALLPFVNRWAGRDVYCETLADEIAAEVGDYWGWPVTVTVRQLTGHGVEAEARYPE